MIYSSIALTHPVRADFSICKSLIFSFNDGFFNKPVDEVVNEYKDLMQDALKIDDFDCSHIEALHDLGHLPLSISALLEGTVVPLRTPVLTIENTKPEFFWITNYLETILKNGYGK